MNLTELFDFKWAGLHQSNDLIDSKTSSAEELSFENQQAVILFFMLNILIGIFLVFNFWQTTIPTAPSTFSKQVHQGVYSVILSVFVASGVIFYYFRGDLNFYPKNQQLRLLAYFWLILNTCLILFTTHKNSIYVLNLGLTHKRIWVYVGLLFTVIGLIYAFIKIKNLKTNWFLLRQFGWIFWVFMIGYALLDWDKIITAYNLHYAKKIDFRHLHSLGRTNIPQLLEYDSVMAQIPKEQRPQDYFPYTYDEFDMDKLLTNDWRSDNLDQIGLRNYLKNRDGK